MCQDWVTSLGVVGQCCSIDSLNIKIITITLGYPPKKKNLKMLTMASDQMLQQVTLLYLKASRLSYILFQTSFFILLLLFYFSCSNSNSS